MGDPKRTKAAAIRHEELDDAFEAQMRLLRQPGVAQVFARGSEAVQDMFDDMLPDTDLGDGEW